MSSSTEPSTRFKSVAGPDRLLRWFGTAALVSALAGPAFAAAEPPGPDPAEAQRASRAAAYLQLMKATLAARRGDIDVAVAEVERATKIRPDDAALLGESANLLVTIGRLDDAEQLARRARELEPEQPAAVRLLADLAVTRATSRSGGEGQLLEAVALYEILARDEDVEPDTLRMLINLKQRLGDTEGSIEVARQLAHLRNGDVQAIQLLARLHARAGRSREGLDGLLDFLEEFGEEDVLGPMIAQLAESDEDWRAVAAAAARRLEQDAHAPGLHRLRAEALVRLRDLPAAIAELEQAHALQPDDPNLRYQLATSYLSVRRLADALELAEPLAESYGDNPDVHETIGEILLRQGRTQQAIDAWNQALTTLDRQAALADGGQQRGLERRADRLRWQVGFVSLRNDNVADAERMLSGIKLRGARETLELAARVALRRDDLEGVRDVIGEMQDNDFSGLAEMFRGSLAARTARRGDAWKHFAAAVEVLGVPAWDTVAEEWTNAEKPELAVAALERWVAASPDDGDAHFALARRLEELERPEDAERELRTVLKLQEDNPAALNHLGYSLADRDVKLEEALSLIRRALELDPWNGAYLDSLGWVYYRLGRFEEAREPLERAAREYPADPIVLEHLGDLYHRLGEHELAVETWQRALNSSPDDPEALQRKIDDVRRASEAAAGLERPTSERSGSGTR